MNPKKTKMPQLSIDKYKDMKVINGENDGIKNFTLRTCYDLLRADQGTDLKNVLLLSAH